jgi:hypothetical protein
MTSVPADHGFTHKSHADGSVVISCDGNAATILRADRAALFLAEVSAEDPQEVMSRWTGKYRPGVEFVPTRYPRRGSSAR